MLTDSYAMASLPAVDLDRAKNFYVEKLGLKVTQEMPGMVVIEAGGGSRFLLYERGATKADHTVLGFNVNDLESTVNELREKGIDFLEYDIAEMGIRTENGISIQEGWKAAWFKDTEGNIISLNEMA